MIGKTISHFTILQRVGGGGMGMVYKAEDTRLKRTVALKFLPPGMTSDPEAKARFIHEAQAASALQHTNICTVHDIDETEDGNLFICMDYYDGQTLDAVIKQGPMEPGEAIRTAVQIVEGLARAHEAGIIHRDVKPSNIILTNRGDVKILDFGLAKLAGQTRVTREGTMLGTVAYMSLEQLRGDEIDFRTDIWSLGVVLFEMLTGHIPYRGEFDAEILYSIVTDELDPIEKYLGDVPVELKRLLKCCLEKDPENRYQSTAELANDLRKLSRQDIGSLQIKEPDRSQTGSRRKPPTGQRRILLGALLIVASLVAGFLAYELFFLPQQPLSATFSRLTEIPGQEGYADVSPDGSFIVYTRGRYGDSRDIYWQRVGGSNPVNLTADSDVDNCHPALSPDGSQIAFRSEREGGGIFLMGATGESVRRVTDVGYNPSWSSDGKKIVVATEAVEGPFDRELMSNLWVIELYTGAKEIISKADAVQPSWSPHGHRIAYWGLPEGTKVRDIWTIPAGGGESVRVTNDAHVDWSPVWSSDGRYLLFSSTRGGSMNLWRVRIDEVSGETSGEPEAVPAPTGFAAFPHGARRTNQFVYVSDNSRLNIVRVAFDPESEEIIPPPMSVTRGSKFAVKPSASPDGKWVAFRGGRVQEDIYLVTPDGSEMRQLTYDTHRDLGPRWTPDGEHVVFYSNRTGRNQIWWIRRDGSGLEQLTDDTTGNVWAPRVFPDGKRIAYMVGREVKITDLTVPLPERRPEALPPPGENLTFMLNAISPDGLWLAGFQRKGNIPLPGIVVYSVEEQSYRKVIDHGVLPVWLKDSRRMMCQHKGRFMLVDRVSGRSQNLGFPPEPLLVGVTFHVSSDSRTVYYTQVEWESDIWLATIQ
jgi:serine/threonine protein kinase